MLLMLKGQLYAIDSCFFGFSLYPAHHTNAWSSPLKPAEIQVLRAQYEKEGDYVGVQTKFNFAWVRFISFEHILHILLSSTSHVG